MFNITQPASLLPDLCKILGRIMRPYIKQKIMGPMFYSSIIKAVDEQRLFIVEHENNVIAFLLFKRFKKEQVILLDKMAVKEDFLNNKIGSMMVEKLKVIAKDENRDIKLRVAKRNEKGIKFYNTNGFSIIEPEKDQEKIVSTMLWKVEEK